MARQRLTEATVRQIAHMIAQGCGDRYIAEFFGISQATVGQIRTGATYRKITGLAHNPERLEKPRRRLTDDERSRAVALAAEGLTATEAHKVLTRQAIDNGSKPPGYDSIAYVIREARKAAGSTWYARKGNPLGRPVGSKGEPRASLTESQAEALRTSGDRRDDRDMRMTPEEIRRVMRAAFAAVEKRILEEPMRRAREAKRERDRLYYEELRQSQRRRDRDEVETDLNAAFDRAARERDRLYEVEFE